MTKHEGITKFEILWRQPCWQLSSISQATRLPLQLIRHLVNVALVAFIALELFNVFVRFADAFAAVLLHNFA